MLLCSEPGETRHQRGIHSKRACRLFPPHVPGRRCLACAIQRAAERESRPNVFDKRVGFMAPKSEDGNWVLDEQEFSPIWSGGQGGREYYTEMNRWIYTFHIQQNVAGLINLVGGREKFVAKAD